MALNQQIQYFPAYSQSHSEIQTSRTQKDYLREESYKKNSHVYNDTNSAKKNQRALSHQSSSCVENSLISESKMYALKKRLLLPSWLLEGVLLVLGTKEPWFESIACSRMGKIFACPSNLNVKTLVPFFLVWHELVSKIFQTSSKETSIKLQINKYITGTKKDVQEISKQIENIFSSPLKLMEIKNSKKTKTLSLYKKGSLNFIRHAQLENDVDGIWLTLNLTHGFKEICYPPELKESFLIGSNNIVSISPIVIQSMGVRASIKKIMNYLFLEFSKQESYSNNSNWNSFRIDCKKISHFHKDFLSTAPAFYDHGVLGWNNCAPNKKISEIKEMCKAPNLKHEIICSWQLSDQVKEAYEIEHEISQKIIQQPDCYLETINQAQIQQGEKISQPPSLFPEPPQDELKKAREERRLRRLNQEKELLIKIKNAEKRAALKAEIASKKARQKVVTQTLFDDGLVVKKSAPPSQAKQNNQEALFQSSEQERQAPKQKHASTELTRHAFHPPTVQNDLGDNEFLILVSEFYESLKPIQKRAFERDRKGMSREQFKAYMSSILQRKKPVHL